MTSLIRESVYRAITPAVVLAVASLAGSAAMAQEIKKKTELPLALQGGQRLVFVVAEERNEAGFGNSTGMAVLRGVNAGLSHQPVPDMPESDARQDPNSDNTVPLRLRAGMRCRTHYNDRATVLGTDGGRVLVELEHLDLRGKVRHSYYGPQVGADVEPVVVDGALSFNQAEDAPVCLSKTKVWINRDVFLALEAAPHRGFKAKKAKRGDSDEDKAAVRRAMGNN